MRKTKVSDSGIAVRGGALLRVRRPPSGKALLFRRRRAKHGLSFRAFRLNFILVFLAALLIPSCTPNRRIIESARTPEPAPTVNATPAVSSLEADLQAMRNADFTFILVFRRRDEAALNADDKAFINANTPPDVNRRRLSDDGKAVIIGSNFPFLPGTIENLTARFIMEDHSKPDAGPLEEDRTGNSNTFANKDRQNNKGRPATTNAPPPANR